MTNVAHLGKPGPENASGLLGEGNVTAMKSRCSAQWVSKYSARARPLLVSFLSDADCQNFVNLSADLPPHEYVVHFFRGKCFYFGWGVEKDLESAFSILDDVIKWACDNYQNDVDAQWILGELYDLKMYGGKPIVEPRKLFEMAYRNGSVFGAYNLARKLRILGGPLEDAVLCLECKRLCANKGFPNAAEKLRQAYCSLLARRDDLPKARKDEIFEDFQKRFNDRGASLLGLGRCYRYKAKTVEGCEKNDIIKQAHLILAQSLNMGEKKAAVELCELYLPESEAVANEWAARAAQEGERGGILLLASHYAGRGFKYREDVGKTDLLCETLDALIAMLPADDLRKVCCVEVAQIFKRCWWCADSDKPRADCNALQFIKSWYLRAIKFGNVYAYSAIGDLYLSGMRCEEAEEWYNKSIKEGVRPPIVRLGAKYEIQGMLDDAVRCYEAAAKIEGPDELLRIARMFNKKGMKERAAEWYIKAMEAGSIAALWAIGNLHLVGKIFPLKKNLALNYFLKAANKGHAPSMKSLADFYVKSRIKAGLEPDYNAAFMWYKKSAEGGYGGAWYELGLMFKEGRGCKKDERMALDCFMKAGKSKVRLAFYEIGQYYESGRCVERNEYEALRCYLYGRRMGSGRCDKAMNELIRGDCRLDYFAQRMIKGEERDSPSFLRDLQAKPGEEESANRVELPSEYDTTDEYGYFYIDWTTPVDF